MVNSLYLPGRPFSTPEPDRNFRPPSIVRSVGLGRPARPSDLRARRPDSLMLCATYAYVSPVWFSLGGGGGGGGEREVIVKGDVGRAGNRHRHHRRRRRRRRRSSERS